MYISSSSNTIFKWLKSLRQKKYRQRELVALIEGERAIRQVIDLGIDLKYIILSEDCKNVNFDFDIIYLATPLFKKLSDTVNSQGMMAVVDLKKIKKINKSSKPIIVLDRLQDPGNLGTILRTAKSFGYSDIWLLKGSVDIYNPKVIRSSMSAVFALNIEQDLNVKDFIRRCQIENKAIVATSLTDAKPLAERSSFDDFVLVFGNEANGISDEILTIAKEKLYIPLNDVESLNVAISAGIFLYEFA